MEKRPLNIQPWSLAFGTSKGCEAANDGPRWGLQRKKEWQVKKLVAASTVTFLTPLKEANAVKQRQTPLFGQIIPLAAAQS